MAAHLSSRSGLQSSWICFILGGSQSHSDSGPVPFEEVESLRTLIIGPNDAGQRLDKFLKKVLPQLPVSMLYKAVRQKWIKRNGKRCQIGDKLEAGDTLTLYLKEEFFAADDALPFLAAPPRLDILYEDDQLLLLNKPQGLLVHEDDSGVADTLLHRMQHYLYQRGDYRPEAEQSFAPALCNRIDRNTSGIVIAAKTAEALRILSQKIKDRELDKRYLCVVCGIPKPAEAVLTGYHRKDAAHNQVEIRDRMPREGTGWRTIQTGYRVLRRSASGRFALLEVELITGRTHQIRAHLAHIGHPLLGDTKYGDGRLNREMGYDWQLLCAYKLAFHFQTDAGPLAYLDGRRFELPHIPFRDAFLQGAID